MIDRDFFKSATPCSRDDTLVKNEAEDLKKHQLLTVVIGCNLSLQ
jgi:hypothetical protein